MRGNAALIPIGFAVFFGVLNGYAIFQPLIVEGRIKTLQETGAKEPVSSDVSLQKSEAVQATNVNEREAKKDLEKPKSEAKPAS